MNTSKGNNLQVHGHRVLDTCIWKCRSKIICELQWYYGRHRNPIWSWL